jgi:L-lactate dehydrogenase complex protein LldG
MAINNARKDIFNRIRTALGRKGALPDKLSHLKLREPAPSQRISPKRVHVSQPELIAEFIRMTTGEATTVVTCARQEDVPGAVVSFIAQHQLPEAVVAAPFLREMPWAKVPIQIRFGKAEKEDMVSVTDAFGGIAETGCLMFLSGEDHPYTLNFLPENQIAVLFADRIMGTPEDGFDRMRKEMGEVLPRTVLFTAGPSRSADIGTSLQFGAHGPKRLHCILVTGEPHDLS